MNPQDTYFFDEELVRSCFGPWFGVTHSKTVIFLSSILNSIVLEMLVYSLKNIKVSLEDHQMMFHWSGPDQSFLLLLLRLKYLIPSLIVCGCVTFLFSCDSQGHNILTMRQCSPLFDRQIILEPIPQLALFLISF